MTDSKPDGDTEFWCRTCMWPEDDVVTMDEIDTSRDPGELTAPCDRIRNALRELRTFRGRW